jgi:hypothetical protein
MVDDGAGEKCVRKKKKNKPNMKKKKRKKLRKKIQVKEVKIKKKESENLTISHEYHFDSRLGESASSLELLTRHSTNIIPARKRCPLGTGHIPPLMT